MSYEMHYRQVEIPELDAFLREYAALCEKHGMQFKVGDYGYDGGHYVTIAAFKDPLPYLDLDEADSKIPCFRAANAKVEAIREAEDQVAQAADERERPIRERELYETLKAKYE